MTGGAEACPQGWHSQQRWPLTLAGPGKEGQRQTHPAFTLVSEEANEMCTLPLVLVSNKESQASLWPQLQQLEALQLHLGCQPLFSVSYQGLRTAPGSSTPRFRPWHALHGNQRVSHIRVYLVHSSPFIWLKIHFT